MSEPGPVDAAITDALREEARACLAQPRNTRLETILEKERARKDRKRNRKRKDPDAGGP